MAAILEHLRSTFLISVAQVKPVAALSRNDRREIDNGQSLDQLVQPGILEHQPERNLLSPVSSGPG
jgi:hypothetical protein